MRIKYICVLTFFALMAAASALGQAEEQSGMLKTEKGVLIVWNEPGNYYSIEIKGEKIEPVSGQMLWFKVDGKFFQIVTTEKKQFVKDAGKSGTDDKAILATHREWESDYISKTINAKLKVDSSWLKLPNGVEVLAWSYEMPKVADKQTAKKQLYLSVVKRDHVFLVNSVVEEGDDEKTISKLLADTMSTLKPTDKPLTMKKAQEQILKN